MIGILDSGLGGLSVLNDINHLMPKQSLCYVGDSASCPYGSKSYEKIQERVTTIVDFLISQGAEIIVIACNSATIACVEALRSVYPIPIIGMEPGVKPAAQITKTGKIGVFATEVSLAGAKFHKLVSNHAQGVEVITQPCPKFVTLVEKGSLRGNNVESAIREYTEPMLARNVDTIVLGCTHYPFLKPEIERLYPNLQIIDTGKAVAKQTGRKTRDLTESIETSHSFFTSSNSAEASELLYKLSPQFKPLKFQILPQ